MAPTEVQVVVVGSANIDLVASVERLPAPGETVFAVSYRQFVGGKGANQAVAAARLGRTVGFVGRVGDDREGAIVREALRAESVHDDHLGSEPGIPTGRALVLVDDRAENSIVVVGGANRRLTPAGVEAAASVLTRAAVVVAQLEVPVEAVTAAARLAAGTFVLNAAPAQVLDDELLALVDVLVVNESEYVAVLGTPLPDDHTEVAAELGRRGLTCVVVVTLGARGALVWDGDRIEHVPAPVVPVVDTTGAGDTFIGALADALSRGEPPPAAARWAVTAASFSVGALGATTGMPRRDDVLHVLQAGSADGHPAPDRMPGPEQHRDAGAQRAPGDRAPQQSPEMTTEKEHGHAAT